MGMIWLVWCGREAYVPIRREIRVRGTKSRFVRLTSMTRWREVIDGFEGESLCAAVGVGAGAQDLDRAEHLIEALAHTGRMGEIIIFADVIDAGTAARCFHAGATEVIAAGGIELPDAERVKACAKEEPNETCLTLGTGYGGAPVCDGPASMGSLGCGGDGSFDSYGCVDVDAGDWEEMPPWDEPLDEPSGWEEVPICDEGLLSACGPDADVRSRGLAGAPEYRADSHEAGVESCAPSAPVVTVISGRGGVGKTTLVAAMAACAARAGLRAAVLDLDLMFGNLAEMLGVDGLRGIEGVGAHADAAGLAECDVEETAMRVGPGLTLWGPCAAPEQAEFCAPSVEQLVGVLRGVADVIFIDTSGFWGDAVAMAVASCDRCLVVGSAGASSAASGRRVVELAMRLGVPGTRMTCVFNRMGARGSGEEQALAFEMGTALRSRARIVDGGGEVSGMVSFGQMNGLIAGSGAFAGSVRAFTSELLQELGCPIAQWLLDEERRRATEDERPRFRLPWRRKAGDLL